MNLLYESAYGQITVKSQVSGFLGDLGAIVRPSGRFPSIPDIPLCYWVIGLSVVVIVMPMMSWGP